MIKLTNIGSSSEESEKYSDERDKEENDFTEIWVSTTTNTHDSSDNDRITPHPFLLQ
jgi:hypothetical protein